MTSEELFPPDQPVVVAYGGGRDSTAAIIEMHRRGIRIDVILMADTGNEKPETYAFLVIFNWWLRENGLPEITFVRYVPDKAPYHTLEAPRDPSRCCPTRRVSSTRPLLVRDAVVKRVTHASAPRSGRAQQQAGTPRSLRARTQSEMPNQISVFDPQFHLDLEPAGDSSASGRTVPDVPPTREQLASAALENTFVQEFIAERVPTWSEERVRANPTCCLVYEHGEVVGGIDELPLMIRHAEKRSGMGMRLGVRPLDPAEEVLAFSIGLRWGPTHPRRIRFRQRRALRSLLARKDGVAVTEAMRRTKRDFVAWARRRPGLADRICDSIGLSVPAFWRAVRCRPPFRPPELTPVRREGGHTSPLQHGDQ